MQECNQCPVPMLVRLLSKLLSSRFSKALVDPTHIGGLLVDLASAGEARTVGAIASGHGVELLMA